MEGRDYLNYFIMMSVFVGATYMYHKHKYLIEETPEDHYRIVEKYLINDSSLARSKKPIMWVHVSRELNARWWESFGSRSSNKLNKPYQFLTIKNIINILITGEKCLKNLLKSYLLFCFLFQFLDLLFPT